MFVKIKRRGGKTYYELAHSKRTGASVVQYSVYLGTTLALTGQEWLDILATTKFPVSLGRLIPSYRNLSPDGIFPARRYWDCRTRQGCNFRRSKPRLARHLRAGVIQHHSHMVLRALQRARRFHRSRRLTGRK